MKLKDWADKEGISYITAYRWFRAGKLPVKAYQAESGTIIIEDDAPETMETNMQDNKLGDSAVSQLINKTVELSKAGGPVEDLATFIISNFRLERHEVPEAPVTRRAKMKPTKEMTENHFKQFMKTDKSKPKANMFLVNENDLDNVVAASEKASAIEGGLGVEFSGTQNFGTVVPSPVHVNSQVSTIASAMNAAMHPLPLTNLVATPKTYTSGESGAVFTRSLGDGGAITNSTLSAATASSISNFSAPASQTVMNSALYCADGSLLTASLDSYNSEFLNEVSEYNPVTYDEARELLSLTSNITDPLTLDRKAKQLCSLDRDTFDGLYNTAKVGK